MKTIAIIGRVTADPTYKKAENDTIYSTFTVAVGKEGETEFFNCVAFNKTATNVKKCVNKGDRIGVVGDLSSNAYISKKDNSPKVSLNVKVDKVEFIETKNEKIEKSMQKPNIEDDLLKFDD